MGLDKATGYGDLPIEAVKILAIKDTRYVVDAMNQVGPTKTRNPRNTEEEQDGADIQRKRIYTKLQ